MSELVIDLLLAAGLLGLGFQAVSGRTLFRSIILFIVFGLVMALAWARLNAPDLALAEAAIGAGITGALLLLAYKRLIQTDPDAPDQQDRRPGNWLALPLAGLTTVMVAIIGWSALGIPPRESTAGLLALDALDDTGVGNPVTGVLLSFRGYDTLAEMGVLLAAFLGARAILDERSLRPIADPETEPPLVGALLSMVVPMSLLVAVYLLRAGGQDPGGAFQAGAVMAAGGVLLILTGRLKPAPATPAVQRVLLALGLLVFSGTGLGMMVAGQPMLAMPGTWAIYMVETALMVSIAMTLVLLFAGSPGVGAERQ